MFINEGEIPINEPKERINLKFEYENNTYEGFALGEKMPFNTYFECYIVGEGSFTIDKVEEDKWEIDKSNFNFLANPIGKEIEKFFEEN